MHIVDTVSVNIILFFQNDLMKVYSSVVIILFSRPKTEQSKTPRKDHQKPPCRW